MSFNLSCRKKKLTWPDQPLWEAILKNMAPLFELYIKIQKKCLEKGLEKNKDCQKEQRTDLIWATHKNTKKNVKKNIKE